MFNTTFMVLRIVGSAVTFTLIVPLCDVPAAKAPQPAAAERVNVEAVELAVPLLALADTHEVADVSIENGTVVPPRVVDVTEIVCA
jgi:hypothetical protein